MSKLERKIAVGIAAVLIAIAAAAFFMKRAYDAGQPRLVLRNYPSHRSISSLTFFPDGKTIAASGNGGIGLWDAETGELLKIETSLDGFATVSPDGEKIAVGDGGGNFVLWTVSTGLVETYHVSSVSSGEYFYKAAFSPDGKTVAASFLENAGISSIRIWNIETGALLHTLSGKAPFAVPFAYSPDRSQIAGASISDVKIWDLKTGASLHTLKGHLDLVNAVAYSPDGKRLASASYDKSVKIWDAQTGALLQTLKDHREFLHFAAYLPDGDRLMIGGREEIKIWDLKTGAPLQTLNHAQTAAGRIKTAAVSPDGRFAAAAVGPHVSNNVLLIWNIDDAAPAP